MAGLLFSGRRDLSGDMPAMYEEHGLDSAVFECLPFPRSLQDIVRPEARLPPVGTALERVESERLRTI
jgi:hypothetical protein